ncbi:hypothetical protein DB347_11330 [Opitutaceae bacterium EW11]|nr:hypothetical protein DB347_11330 [Opitutaceae bacterium EW11]
MVLASIRRLAERISSLEVTPNVAFGLCCLASLIVRSACLSGAHYSPDDWRHAQEGAWSFDSLAYLCFSQGRPLQPFLVSCLDLLGFDRVGTGAISSTILGCTLVAVGTAYVRAWGLRVGSLGGMLCVLLFVAHPYQTEIFTFTAVGWLVVCGYGLALVGILIGRRGGRSIWTGALLFALALADYQIVLNVAVVGWLCTVAARLSHYERGSRARDMAVRLPWPELYTIVLGTFAYALLTFLISKLLNYRIEGRGQLLRVSDIGNRFGEVLHTLKVMYRLADDHKALVSPAASVLFIASVLCLACTVCFRKGMRRTAVIYLVLALGVVMSVGIVAVGQVYWPVPRVLVAVALVWSATFAIWWTVGSCFSRLACVSIAAVVCFSFCGVDAKILNDQIRLNRWDSQLANRILAKMEQDPGFAQIKRVSIVGGRWWYDSRIGTVVGDMNVSARYPAWSRLAFLNEATGSSFQPATPEEQQRAEQWAAGRSGWPTEGCILIQGEVATIALQ